MQGSMKQRFVVVRVGFVFAAIFSYLGFVPVRAQETDLNCAATRIMPLGDSITVGYGTGTDKTTYSDITGYRQPLYQKLRAAGYNVDFVGSVRAGQSVSPSFDVDNEGHPGYTPAQILSGISGPADTWLNKNPAKVVLLHIGTNGLRSDRVDLWVTNTGKILEAIDKVDSSITVVLALIVNQNPTNQVVTQFNTKLRQVAQTRIANGDDIRIVDMETALSYPGDLADQYHPNQSGYNKMANAWYNALDDFLTPCSTTVSKVYLPLVKK